MYVDRIGLSASDRKNRERTDKILKDKNKKNDSFSLLNQLEIDTLVKFLTDKKNTVDSDVMSQNSIDKLINLIQTDQDRLALNIAFAYSDVDVTTWSHLDFRKSPDDVCELRFSRDEEKGYVSLSIYNATTDETTPLSPDNFDEHDTKEWGLSIPPTIVCQIASMLAIKFTQETYDTICKAYAEQNYHNENHKLPEILLPDNGVLLNCLL